jgi:hypothetical protein
MKQIKLNPRQLWVHFIAFWLFIGSFRYLVYLINIRLFKILMAPIIPGQNFFDRFNPENVNHLELLDYINILLGYWIYAILVAFLISMIISWKKGWSWINSVLVAFLTAVLYRVPFYRWHDPGWHTTIYYDPVPRSVEWFVAVGIALLAMGLTLFLSKAVNNYIGRGIHKKSLA